MPATARRFAAGRSAVALLSRRCDGVRRRPASALIEHRRQRAATSSRCRSRIPTFVGAGSDAQLGVDIASVIAADLKRSGLFLPVDPATFVQQAHRSRTRRRASPTGG